MTSDTMFCDRYIKNLEVAASADYVDWSRLANATVLLSGGTGQIGRHLVDTLLLKDRVDGLNCRIGVITRNVENARQLFSCWKETAGLLSFFCFDFTHGGEFPDCLHSDYVLNLASNTHPVAYANDPGGTIFTNVYGTASLLDLSVKTGARRFLLASSNEIYGENRGDTEVFQETDMGYIDCNTLRAGYPESKRCAEALCQAYRRVHGQDIVIARLTRTYGPTLLSSDSKAMTQFIRNAMNGEDIILKSNGNQVYSYTYVTDAVTGLLTILTKGIDGEAYNVAEESYDISLKEMAGLIAARAGVDLKFGEAGKVESAGFSKVTKSRLSGEKLRSLGWRAAFTFNKGMEETLEILKAK